MLEAEHGKAALELLERSYDVVDAVLLDLVMPIMNGYEVLKQIRSNPNLSNLPVIVTTGSTEAAIEVEALSLGANDFITKPYNPAVIKHRLWNTINLRETAAYVNTVQRDKLTGLYNRETFFAKVEELVAKQEPGYYVMACFDVNNFKLINDQYGNAKGDEVLKQLAKVFRDGFGAMAGICCRIMADNFAVLYPYQFMNSAALTDIRQAAATLDGSMHPISFSIGRYLVTDLSLSGSAMYDRASIAEESVKARFDNHIAQYNESMRQSIIREQEIINDMTPALAKGQFEVWLQPQYNHSSGALIGAEALARWRHPEKGLIAPNVFIPIFERNGFIYELDKSIWRQVCIFLRRWIDEGCDPLPVSVNVSRYDVFREDFYAVITGLVNEYRLPLHLLRLEITESAFAQANEQIIIMVKRLIAYGFIVEIDDFGSGYSSLNTLKDVPANVLKLDMHFLEGNENSSRGGNILESIVRMARWLGMPVIAEGVETKAQADYLRSIGCYYVQGYLYAKPMTIAEYEALAKGFHKEHKMVTLKTVEALDNNAFWDPASMETLIFNSYVGGACIFEYQNGKAELLRVNEKYARELGGPEMSIEEALELDLSAHMDKDGLAALIANIQNAIDTDDESTCELRLFGLTPHHNYTYIRSTVRVIARTGGLFLLYCFIANTTAQREAEQKVRENNDQLVFLNDTAHDLFAQTDTETGVNMVLQRVLDYFFADRAYVIELDDQKRVSNNTYEVCAAGIDSEKERLQAVPYEATPFWWRTFRGDQYINIEDVSSLDGSRAEEREILEAQGIRSLIAVPLRRDNRMIGFIGVDNPRQQQSHVGHLKAIADYLAASLTRRDLTVRIEKDNRTLLELMNDTPGGFILIKKLPDGSFVPIYANGGFCKLVGATGEEVMENYRKNILWGVHPDDIDIVRSAIGEMVSTGATRNIKYRLRHGSGSYVWVVIFGHMTVNDSGEAFFNVYYTDVSEQEKHELTFRETLSVALDAMMASSTDLSFVKDKNFTYICCSGAFAKMVGLADAREVVGKTDFDLFDETLAGQYRADDLKLLKSGESLVNYMERIPLADGAVRYSTTSKYLLHDSLGNVVGLYGTGRDITEDREAYAQLKLLSDSIPGGLAMYEVSPGQIRQLYFSNGFYALTGYSREEYLALTATDPMHLIFLEDTPAIKEQLDAVLKGGTSLNYTYRIHCKNGGFRWLNLQGSVLERRGSSATINAVNFDITEQKTSEETLRIREEEYRLAIAQSGKLIYRYNHETDSVDLPESTASVFGLPARRSHPPDDMMKDGTIAEESIPSYIQFYQAIKRGDKTGSVTIRRRLGDERYRWFTSRFSTIFDDAGKPVSTIVMVEDVTKAREQDSKAAEHKKNELVLQLVAEHSSRLVYRYDLATRTSYADAQNAVISETGLPDSAIDQGKILPESIADYRRLFQEIHKGKRTGGAKIHMKNTCGTPCWIDMKYSLILNDGQPPKEAVLSLLDVTENHEKELAYSRYLQTTLYGDSAAGVLLYLEADVTLDIIEKFGGSAVPPEIPPAGSSRAHFVEYMAQTYLPTPKEQIKCCEFFSRDHLVTAFSDGIHELSADWSVVFPNGRQGYIRSELQMVQDPYSGHIKSYNLLRDITDIKQEEIAVKRRAETDGMTGLYNKTTTESMIRAQLSRSDKTSCALLIVDLDNLKTINDELGHAQGDQAIQKMAVLLRNQFRKTDIVGRIGGDEFAIFLDGGGNEARLRGVMTAFMRKLSTLSIGEEKKAALRGSIGIAISAPGKEPYEELFKKADKALYHVKRNGKGDFAFYAPEMEQTAYQYKGHREATAWLANDFGSEELDRLLQAVSAIYPLVIFVNLTQNSYAVMQDQNFPTKCRFGTGVFEELIAAGVKTIHPEDRDSFAAFSREQLLAAHARGKTALSTVVRQLGDDGVYRLVQVDVIFVGQKDQPDIWEITLAREIPAAAKPETMD